MMILLLLLLLLLFSLMAARLGASLMVYDCYNSWAYSIPVFFLKFKQDHFNTCFYA